MSELKIELRDGRTAFQPGAELAGVANWESAAPPRAVEVRLLWFTRGKGTEDVQVVNTVRFDDLQAGVARPFRFRLPPAPYSFSGRLISLRWAVELVLLPTKDSTRVEFVLAPDGEAVVLPQIEPPKQGFRFGK